MKNGRLQTINRDYRGNLLIDGIFTNGDVKEKPPIGDVIKWKLSSNPQRREKDNDSFRLKILNNKNCFNTSDDMIVWLGHASFLIRINGISFLTDPCFNNLPSIKRLSPLPCAISEICNIDYILISHGHRDHCDLPSINRIIEQNPQCELLVPLKMGSLFRGIKNTTFQEAGWFQQYNTSADVSVVFLPSLHWHRRGLFDFNKILWGSFMIQARGLNIYFAGDTGYSKHFKTIRNIVGPVDIFIAPIGTYRPEYLMKMEHINPEEAVRASNELDADLLIPMHFGTYDLSNEPLGEPLRWLKKEATNLDGKILDLAVGEVFSLQP